jgi:hypothetical protein
MDSATPGETGGISAAILAANLSADTEETGAGLLIFGIFRNYRN